MSGRSDIPRDCLLAWQTLTGRLDPALHARRGGWYSTRDLFHVTGRPSTERKARRLVEIGFAERRHVPDRQTGGLFAEFRAIQPNSDTLFDLPPPSRDVIERRGRATR